jgi:hypothetical protein
MPVRRYAVMAVLLSLATPIFAAATDTNGLDNMLPPWEGNFEQAVVGEVTLTLTNTDLHITGPKVNLVLDWPWRMMEGYLCAVRNPFAEPRLEDGHIIADANFQEFESYHELQATNFARFAFFTNRPTTIGLMTGFAGADGGSSQTLYLVDVETGAHVCIPLSDGYMPVWLQPGVYPPPFALTDNDGIQSDVAWSPGGKPRLTQMYFFRNGQYRRDLAAERKEMVARFQAAQLTPAECKRIQAAEELDLVNEKDLERLLDFVHYGKFTGQQAAVDRILKLLRPECRERLTGSRNWAYEHNGIDRVDEAEQRAQVGGPAYVYVESGDTLYAIARRFEERGVTVEGLLAANPGLKPERLQIGQKVFIYKQQKVQSR